MLAFLRSLRTEKKNGKQATGTTSADVLFSFFLAFYFLKMLLISYKFQERSEGADEILIWIPQTSVAIGSTLFFICIFHHLIKKIICK